MRAATLPNGHAKPTTIPQTNSSSDDRLLSELVELWTSRNEKDLEIRWRMGAMLNGHPEIGPPTKRKAYGKEIMIQAAERLSLDEGELSRLRWFAHHFQSVEDLNSKHPEVKSWRAVKVLLATLSPKKGKSTARKTAAKNVTSRLCRTVTSSLKSATDTLRRLGSPPDGKNAEKLLEKLQEFVEAANSCLQVRLTFEKR
jgi:hypothetical protein